MPLYPPPSGGAGGAWSLKEYSTANATSITSGTLDLSTDLRYKVILECDSQGGAGAENVLYAAINGVVSGTQYWALVQGRNYDGTTAANENLDFKDSQWNLTSSSFNSFQLELDFSLVNVDGTNSRVVANYTLSALYGGSTEKIAIAKGTLYNNVQTNMTSLSFNTVADAKNWRMWILKPLTA